MLSGIPGIAQLKRVSQESNVKNNIIVGFSSSGGVCNLYFQESEQVLLQYVYSYIRTVSISLGVGVVWADNPAW